MRIVIDARFWGPKHSGLGIYTKNLVLNLASLDSSNTYILLVTDKIEEKLPENFSTKIVPIQAYSLAEQIVLPWILYSLQADIVHFPSINVPIFFWGSYVVTVHDLIKHYSRGMATTTHNPLFYWFKYIGYLVVFNWVCYWARHIIVPSNDVKQQLIKKCRVSDSRITVTYEAANLSKISDRKTFKQAFELPEKYAVYTGNAYPHKNLERLISSWKEIFEKSGTVLFICSGRSVFATKIESLIENLNAGAYIKFLGSASDQDLRILYSRATVYVFPSLLEGFGLPGLDAMEFGLPVVCSDIPVLHEVYGEAAYYFNPKDTHDIADKVLFIVNDLKTRKILIEKGYKQNKKYSWSKMSAETLRIYENCFRLRQSQ